MNYSSVLQETAGSDSSTVEQTIGSMETGGTHEADAGEETSGQTHSCPRSHPTATQEASGSPAEGEGTWKSEGENATPAAERKQQRWSSEKQSPQQMLMSELIEKPRQLRLSLERSKGKELEMLERQLKLDQAAAEREERLISVLEKMTGN
ncbi:uncharacterized protein LOC119389298 [Rhipicephalus sanguineus]|uniref:uncharacterized protein LOC119389298 n=1 Tax=Rhipicephalus sanguineus TaxID=34632 RepID=UPI001892F2AD|nr:uncharacterized protein LOC119389298 [Rhipicephalus sanguineus]